jgi:malate dehydrogenase (oxaloacetate-decarboxylating)
MTMKSYSPANSLIVRLHYSAAEEKLGQIESVVRKTDGLIESVKWIDDSPEMIVRELVVLGDTIADAKKTAEAIGQIEGVTVDELLDRTFELHRGGKIDVVTKSPIDDRASLSMAYTPGVARVCLEVEKNPESAFDWTIRRNTVAIVTDGSAVLGLGNIGPAAGLPVMEGKAALFKEFADVNAFPICLDTQDPKKIIEVCKLIAPTFGGINLEDISSPRCVEIEERLIEELDIPVFHDDQHGTAVVVVAALLNALKLVDKTFENIRVTFSGAGAAGVAITKLLQKLGVGHIVLCDREGAIHCGRDLGDNPVKQWLAENTNPDQMTGSLSDCMKGADVFVGVSSSNLLSVDDVKSMAANAIVFGLANPDPEIKPELALPHVAVMATGRSDYPNQINNVLCFPGLFKGLLAVRARRVTDEMKIAAAEAIASKVDPKSLCPGQIIPSALDKSVAEAVADAVAQTAIRQGLTRQ